MSTTSHSNLPIHFFTIVLNGQPFIRYHLEVFKQLNCPWNWHIVEGVAELKHDTAWSLQFGGKVNESFHKNGRSMDGTSEYLDALKKELPEQITLYRKPEGAFWDGKIEMVNAPLKNISEDCLLWQIDVDELWTVEQIEKCRQLFMSNSEKTSASYFCRYFVGPNLVTTTRNTYGNQSGEWLRTWRFLPGCRWLSHEPPRLCKPQSESKWIDVASIHPFTREEMEKEGLVFQHYAYVTEEQLRFKESYYGYADAVIKWKVLQLKPEMLSLDFGRRDAADYHPHPNPLPKGEGKIGSRSRPCERELRLRDYFPWVQDETRVDTVQSLGIYPLAYPVGDSWVFDNRDPSQIKKILFIRTDAIGDNILAASMLEPIQKKYSSAKIVVVCQEHIRELYQSSPFVGDIITFNRDRCYKDEDYKKGIVRRIQQEKADLVLNSVYSREPMTDIFAIGSDGISRVVFNSHHCNYMTTQNRDQCNKFYTRVLPGGSPHQSELQRHRDFLKGIGITSTELKPIVWLREEDEAFADKVFAEHGLEKGKVIALFAGSQWDQKVYEGYGEALAAFCNDHALSVLALGSQADFEVNQKHLDAINYAPTVNGCGKATLRQTAALLKRCCLGVGADSAIAHMGAALEIPHVIVLGGGHFGRFLPYSAKTSIVCLPLECYGCSWACKFPVPYCTKEISPRVLLEAIRATHRGSSLKPRIFVQGSDQWKHREDQPKWQLFEEFIDRDSVEMIFVGEEGRLSGIKSQEYWGQVSQALEMVQTLRRNQQSEKAARVLTQAITRFPRAIHLQKLQAEYETSNQPSM